MFPPKAKAEVLLAPLPAKRSLAVFKSPTSVHVDPSYASVTPVKDPVLPPNPKAEVCVPADPNSCRAVFKLPPVAQPPMSEPAPVNSSVVATAAV